MLMRNRDVASWLIAVSLILAGCEARVPPATISPTPAAAPSMPAATSTAGRADELAAEDVPAIRLRPIDKAGFDALVAAHAGHVILVDFWATWCPTCREYFPHTVALSRKYGPQGLVVISLSCDDEKKSDQALEILREHEATFQNLRAVDGSDENTFEEFAIDGGALPHYKLYDRQGRLSRTFATDPEADKQFSIDDIDAAVAELLRINL